MKAPLVAAYPASNIMETEMVVKHPNLNENLLNRSVIGNMSADGINLNNNLVSRDVSPSIQIPRSVQSSSAKPSSKQRSRSQADQVMESHPTRHMSRALTTDIQRQNINLRAELGADVQEYLRTRELQFDTTNCLERHEITAPIRARMVDWIIEVLTNFYCDDQTFFIAVSLMDRFFKGCPERLKVSSLHVVGVTSMFVASKFEDINPLRMKTVDEKIAQKKIPVQKIKQQELEILKVVRYQIHAPTILDFLKHFLNEVLGIQIGDKAETAQK